MLDNNLDKALPIGDIATLLAFAFSLPGGLLLAHLTGISTPIFVLILANSSSAVMMPIVHERKLDGQMMLLTSTWVAIADAVTVIVIALPLAMSTANTLSVCIGGVLVLATALVLFFGLGKLRQSKVMTYYRELSKLIGIGEGFFACLLSALPLLIRHMLGGIF